MTNNKVLIFLLFASLLMVVFGSGCNTPKRATKRAERKLDKSIRLDPMPFARQCAKEYNPIDSIHEKIVFKPGQIIRDTLVDVQQEIINDTVYLTKHKTITVKQTDTVDLSRFQTESNKAAQDSLTKHYGRVAAVLTKERDNARIEAEQHRNGRNTWRSVAMIAMLLIVLFFVWKFIKSKFKILG